MQENNNGLAIELPEKSLNEEKQDLSQYHYATDKDKAAGVETAIYENGSIAKRVKLSTGQIAIVRTLKANGMIEAEARAEGNEKKVYTSLISVCTKIDDRPVYPEDVELMWARDYATLKVLALELNF